MGPSPVGWIRNLTSKWNPAFTDVIMCDQRLWGDDIWDDKEKYYGLVEHKFNLLARDGEYNQAFPQGRQQSVVENVQQAETQALLSEWKSKEQMPWYVVQAGFLRQWFVAYEIDIGATHAQHVSQDMIISDRVFL